MKKRIMTVVLVLVLVFTFFTTTAFAASTLRKGSSGGEVKTLQTLLNSNGFSLVVDGKFGSNTLTAVKSYQSSHGLSVDGIVGSKTWASLLASPAEAKPEAKEEAAPSEYPMLAKGAKGDDVKQLQSLLNARGASLVVDGLFGPKTDAAVKSFQSANGLSANGIVDDATWGALLTADPTTPGGTPAPEVPAFLPLSSGSTGDAVNQLQQALISCGYTVTVSGTFDAATEDAVKQYQTLYGFSADGIVGAQAWNRIVSVEKFISVAQSKIGTKYVLGGKGPSSFDCSGFVYWCLNQAGVSQRYMTSDAWQKCTAYKKVGGMNDLTRGDVISFEGHVGIYAGGGQMIDASSSAGAVHTSNDIQNNSYWKSNFVCGFRIF